LLKITVLIVDDHQIFRHGLRDSMSLDDDIQVVGEASDGESALQLARELAPRVVLADVNLPGINGLQLVQRMRKEAPGARAVILTAYDDEEQLYHAIRSGAHAYFSKEVSRPDCSSGSPGEPGTICCRRYGHERRRNRALVAARGASSSPLPAGDELQEAFVPLSPREMEIIR